MTKWLNPDATQADLGEQMQAYYDEKRKVWVFPGEDPDEKAKPTGPPPTTPLASSPSPAPTHAVASDPLAAMMMPPKRAPSNFQMKSKSVGATPNRPYMPPMMMFPGQASPNGPAPQFAVFTPKPTVTSGDDNEE